MPEMISLRNYRLASTLGHTITFEANKPRDVPDVLVPEALAAGCAMVDPDNQVFFDDKSKPKFPLQGDIRRSVIYLVLKSIIAANKSKDFDASGTPKLSVVAERVGFDISATEVRDVLKQYHKDIADRTDPVLHDGAPTVIKIVDASGSQDLVAIAGTLGIKEETVKGLTTRELRTKLLTQVIGE